MSQSQGVNAPIVVPFHPSLSIRIIVRNGEPWFVAADVCAALGLTWKTGGAGSIGSLDADEKGVALFDTHGGQQQLSVVSESGLNCLILRCRDAVKPGTIPHRFRKWVTSEVLPSIRKTGTYMARSAIQQQPPVFLTLQDMENLTRLVWIACHDQPLPHSWTQSAWACLRRAAKCPAPARFEVRHVPALTAEIRRILELAGVVREVYHMAGGAMLKRVLKGNEDAAAVIADMDKQAMLLLDERRDDLAGLLDNWCNHDIASFAQRRDGVHMHYQSDETRLLA